MGSYLTMSAAELDGVLDQIPSLSARPRQVEDLSGGLTNRNVKVTTPTGTYVARCSDPDDGSGLGIDREAEAHNTRAASHTGVGAPVVDHRPDLGVLVIEFIEGRTLARADFTDPDVVRRAAVACRRLHAGPAFQGTFDVFERQRGYLRTAQTHGYRVPAGYHAYAAVLERVRQVLAVGDEGTLPCNNDLLAENFIDDGEQLWLIDYEYAGSNDPCFELGNIGQECALDADRLEALVTAYYGRARRSRLARARLLGAVGAYGWTLWGAIQHAVSPLDFDFWEWATERYRFATALFDGPDLPRLLDDALAED